LRFEYDSTMPSRQTMNKANRELGQDCDKIGSMQGQLDG
jgi:hypothetical protein